jgi:hypothetical protein
MNDNIKEEFKLSEKLCTGFISLWREIIGGG